MRTAPRGVAGGDCALQSLIASPLFWCGRCWPSDGRWTTPQHFSIGDKAWARTPMWCWEVTN